MGWVVPPGDSDENPVSFEQSREALLSALVSEAPRSSQKRVETFLKRTTREVMDGVAVDGWSRMEHEEWAWSLSKKGVKHLHDGCEFVKSL